MIKKNLLLLFTILSALVLGACGGGGGAVPIPVPDPDPDPVGGGGLVTAEFTKTIAADVSTGGTIAPFNTSDYRRSMFLYRASDVKGSGKLTSISLRLNQDLVTAASCPNTTIRIGHTSLPEFDGVDNNFASYVEEGKGSLITVVNDTTVNIPTGVDGDYFTIQLTTPFDYNGVDNLIVDFERTTACNVTVSNRRETMAYNGRLSTTIVASATGIAAILTHHMKFNFAGGDNVQSHGGVLNNTWPFNTITPKIQSLYTAADIDGSGPITAIGFQMNATSVAAEYTYTVRMGHTSLAMLTNLSNFVDNYNVDSVTTVANAATFSIPAGIPAGGWFWLPLPDGVFNYNGTDNLLVEVEVPVASASNSIRTASMGSDIRLHNTTADATASETADGIAYHIRFRFNGGTVDVNTDLGGSTGNIFSAGDNSRQGMFLASELGTAGKITAVSCRLQNTGPTIASDYPNYTVLMGHTALTELTDTYADNYDDATIVHSGIYSLAAGQIQGDRLVIPITPFAYDGIRNLVVYFYSDGGAANTCEMSSVDAIRYPNQTMAAGSYLDLTGTPSSRKLDMHFTISK